MTAVAAGTNGKAAVLGDREHKPPVRPVGVDTIPDGIKLFDRWVGWSWTWNAKRKKWDKPPINTRTGGPGSSTDSATWCRFDEAIAAQHAGRIDGVGFVLGEADGDVRFAGIDLDDCRNGTTGKLSDTSLDIIKAMDTYTEFSPSGTGVKLLCIGTLPVGARKKNKAGTVEVYDSGRYFTITGERYRYSSKLVEARESQLLKVWQKYIDSEQPKRSRRQSTGGSGVNGRATSSALAQMLRYKPKDGEDDGSNRKYAICCRIVEHDLSDDAGVAAFREYEAVHGFPVELSDSDIIKCIRDAEKKVERGSEVVIANFEKFMGEDEDGKPKEITVPLSMTDIIDEIRALTGGWPRRVDNMLFVDDPKHGLHYFDRRTTAALIGWLRRLAKVKWNRGGSFVAQSELFAEIERTAQRYDAIELLPHEPPIVGIYYRGEAPRPGDGTHLRKLLDRFRPETTIDRDLIQAAFMTTFWGGPPGQRPAFVFTSDDGRGVGKTSVAKIGGILAGGVVDVTADDPIADVKTRLLSPEARTCRVGLMDNVKSHRFSWAAFEGLITCSAISGRQLFVGEGQRPNLLTWFLTLNGVSMATDMTQRSVIIKLVKGENSGPWYEETIRFIDEHRTTIVGDIIGALRAEPFPLPKFSRWAAWEKDVLCRLPEPSDAQRLILERQGEVNCELDEAELIEEHFAEQLVRFGYCPQTAQVRIPVATAARWFGWALGEKTKTATASKRLHQMAKEGQLGRIGPELGRSHGRCFVWTGPAADVYNDQISNDLTDRIAKAAADGKDG